MRIQSRERFFELLQSASRWIRLGKCKSKAQKHQRITFKHDNVFLRGRQSSNSVNSFIFFILKSVIDFNAFEVGCKKLENTFGFPRLHQTEVRRYLRKKEAFSNRNFSVPKKIFKFRFWKFSSFKRTIISCCLKHIFLVSFQQHSDVWGLLSFVSNAAVEGNLPTAT